MNEELLGMLRQLATVTVFPAFLVKRILADGQRHPDRARGNDGRDHFGSRHPAHPRYDHRHDGGTSMMKVRDIMTTDVRACLPEEPLSSAVRIMWDCDCGIVPVVDRTGRVIGAITDRDICIACWSRDSRPSDLIIADTMARDVQCCGPDDTVSEAEHAIRACQVRRLPVVDDNGHLQGIISLADITRAAERQLGGGHQPGELKPEELVESIAAVSRPHQGGVAAATIAAASARQAMTSQQRPVE
ncbi:MAG TPA: CBS domain-containing protein [Candidatus Binatia bacterium]|nr:CBS domain-containing protein [Candidatus Binatia bacterium]